MEKIFNEFMYYNRTELEEIISGTLDPDWIRDCILVLLVSITNILVTEEVFQLATEVALNWE